MSSIENREDANGRRLDRRSAVLLGTCAFLAVVFMSHHPTHADSALNAPVHGGLIVLMVAMYVGLLRVADRLHGFPGLVRASVVVYSLGVVAMAAAALISGFLVPEFVAEMTGSTPEVAHENHSPVLVLCHISNQVLARAGSLAFSAAILGWSIALQRRGSLGLVLGLGGSLLSVTTCALLFTDHLTLDVHGMGAVILGQSLWSIGVAFWLYRNASPAGN